MWPMLPSNEPRLLVPSSPSAGSSAWPSRSPVARLVAMQCYARGMKFFVKAVVTGFALSLGSALFKKLQQKLGLDDAAKPAPEVIKQDGATDPALTAQPT